LVINMYDRFSGVSLAEGSILAGEKAGNNPLLALGSISGFRTGHLSSSQGMNSSNANYWAHIDTYEVEPVEPPIDPQNEETCPPIPEPATLLLVGLGLAGAGLIRNRKQG
jgi:hypothetical protein